MTTFEAFRDEVFAQAKEAGFADYELYYLANNGFSVRVFEGEISEYKNSSTEGVGFRGTFDGKMGYASSEKLDAALIPAMLENAKANAGIIESDDIENLYPGDEEYPEADCFNPALDETTAAQKIEWAIEMEKYARGLDPRIKMADYGTVATEEVRMAIANSHGLNVSQKRNRAAAFIVAIAEENGVTKTGSEMWAGRDFADFDYKAVAKKAVDEAVSYLGAKSLPSGEYPIVFNNETAASVFRVFSRVFIAEHGQKGFSLLNKERLGEAIAGPFVNLRDDGVTDLSLDSQPFDAEGAATQNKAIIENGVLKTLLYNTKSAAKDGVKSTGNASKSGIDGAISTSCTNFYLVPGEASFDELIAGIEKGVLITDLAGLHSGVNPVSGDFSVSADGFLIENGKKGRPVEQITVAGNFFELLKNIGAIGNDLRFRYGPGGAVGMASVLVNGLRISGV